MHTSCGDIDTTTNHPFYVIDKGWVAAGDLVEGDEVYLIDGSTAVITSSDIEKLNELIKVYNLEVAVFNTYFVGDEAVLVHNYERTEEQRRKYKEYTGKDPTGEVHHGLPEEFHDEFAAAGLDTNSGEYYFDLPKEIHRLKEGMGIHTNSSKLGMTWNAAWKKFFKSNPDADKSSILAQLEKMIEITGIGKYRAVAK